MGEMHSWSFESGKEPKVGEPTGPTAEPTIVILSNGHSTRSSLIHIPRDRLVSEAC